MQNTQIYEIDKYKPIHSETRTFLSKLIWLGNGGKRPQYGNPETKVPRPFVLSALSQLELTNIVPLIYFSPALLVAATHSTVGGNEEDGRKKICGIISYQLHRDIEAVSCSGEISNRYLTNFIFNTVSS